ncbi:2Fe-2S iron-sulfur cluster-binding protein [Mycolicibacterium sp. 050232]|uniref:2Fe-2S iron-sulfur cluster-binding protein n=1 Tax=Mycolicibacterium sp. 050232 TaxID=3113982 RepID=UPI002E2BCEA8|nr:2Fe-2S iron-sulfur cluster-binding protein [Mycolicibacterium sp. 050232]MED5812614.1 2Fe-2S iron-sulfur cluster-binding protein [Mycolicibacterium sp. 050232]
MPTVTVRPGGITFEATEGQTVMAAALAAGLKWPTVCGGNGDCLVCHVAVLQGARHLAEPSAAEKEAVRNLTGDHGGRGEHVRLACQAGVLGDVVVEKRGVRKRRNQVEQEESGG